MEGFTILNRGRQSWAKKKMKEAGCVTRVSAALCGGGEITRASLKKQTVKNQGDAIPERTVRINMVL